MATARRLYLYGVALTSLVALVGGLQRLLVFVIDQLATALGPAPIAGDVTRSLDELSLAVSVIALALPVWALHWWAAERLAARGGGVGSDAGSVVRAVHFLLVRQLSLAAFLIAILAFVGWVVGALLAVDSGDEPVGDSLGLATIAGGTWAYHTWLRRRDLRRDEIVGGAAAVARLDRHLGAAIGLVVAAFATSDVIMISLRLVVDRPLRAAPDWWQVPLAEAVARIVIGLGAFLVHDQEVRSTFAAEGRQREDDRGSRVRSAWMGLLVLGATGTTIAGVAYALESVMVRLLGSAAPDDLGLLAENVLGPPLAVVPLIALGWWVTRTASGERRALGGGDPEGPVRLALHLVSFVGLLVASVGAVRLVGIVIEGLAGQPSLGFDEGIGSRELAQATGFVVAGGAPWAATWPRMRVSDSHSRTIHRAYLYAVIAASLAAGVPAAAMILYRVLSSGLGAADVRDAVAALPMPIATVVVAGVVAGFHGRLLRRDARADLPAAAVSEVVPATPAAAVPEVVPATPAAAVPPAAAAPPPTALREIALRLRVPDGSDPSVILRDLRASLPAGSTLEDAAAAAADTA